MAVVALAMMTSSYTPEKINGHDCVDMGLSVKWATCNIGASKPGEYGDYYAFAELKTKKEYSWETLKYCTSGQVWQNAKFNKYVSDARDGVVDNKLQLDIEDDVAHAKWGASWRLPTKAEQEELMTNCTWTWTEQDGNAGYKVTSKINGNSIFLPAGGYVFDEKYFTVGEFGGYWSSTLDKVRACNAYTLYFYDSEVMWLFFARCSGRSIRPVSN